MIEADDRKAAELAMIENSPAGRPKTPWKKPPDTGPHRPAPHDAGGSFASRVGRIPAAPSPTPCGCSGAGPCGPKSGGGRASSAGHARALVPLSPAQQIQAANAIIEGGLLAGAGQTELLAKRLATGEKPEKPAPSDAVDYTAVAQRELSGRLGRGIKIVNGRKKAALNWNTTEWMT